MRSEIRRILVPTDFSDGSLAALHFAASLAERLGASIDALHVLDEKQPRTRAVAEDAMRRFLGSLEGEKPRASGRIEPGDARCEIVEIAASGDYDLIVMGTLGRPARTRPMLGSVAEHVVRCAPCPVVTVRVRSGSAVES